MTRIQQVHWERDMDYLEHPSYVSGNMISHALRMQLDHDVHHPTTATPGMFVPTQPPPFPDAHSPSRVHPYM